MEDLSLHILDIAENSINAGAALVRIGITEDSEKGLLTVEIEDNGKGMSEDVLEKVLDPFYTTRTTRKVGLGLSLLAQSARETGGDISIRSKENEGTVVTAEFRKDHIDMKPLGNIVDTLVILIAGNPLADFMFTYRKDGSAFSFDTREIKADLEEIPINSPAVISFLRTYLNEALSDLKKVV